LEISEFLTTFFWPKFAEYFRKEFSNNFFVRVQKVRLKKYFLFLVYPVTVELVDAMDIQGGVRKISRIYFLEYLNNYFFKEI